MPSLKDLVCHVQWAETGSPFPEYGTVYGDGLVETYIAIPSHPQVFTISLSSRKFISEGLAMVVFIDGQYQCNRNRVNLQAEKGDEPTSKSTVKFLLRQKEKPLGDGTYMGREWRFDDCNLVTQLPQGTDESHFHHLGQIEVLVLRCQSKHTRKRAMSASSSGEDSAVLEDNEGSKQSGSVAGNKSDKAAEPAAEAEEAFGGGLFGLFDGAADEPPPRHFSGDAPADGHYGYWQPHSRPPARYGPQQGAHPADVRPAFHEAPRTRYSYRDSPPFAGYACPVSPPPPPPPPHPDGRHVHFDYGDGRGPQYREHHARYDRHPHSEWDRNHRPEYTRSRPSSYYEPDHHRGNGSFADYADQGHYKYDPASRVYVRHPEAHQAYDSYRPRSPAPERYAPRAYAPPPGVYPHPAIQPVQQLSGHPPVPTHHVNVPNPPATVPNGQPVPPPNMSMQANHVPQVPPQPVSYFVPAAMPPHMTAPPFAGAVPVYPPLGTHPLFHTQGPNNGSGQAAQATSGPPENSQQQEDKNTGNGGNNNPGEVRYETNKDTDGWGDTDNNQSGNDNSGDNNGNGWGASADNKNSGGNNGDSWDNSADNDNSGGNNDWENNNGSGNNTGDGGNNDWQNNNDSGNNTGGGGRGDTGGNNDTGNNDWSNDNNAQAGDNNNQSWEHDNSGNQQGGNGGGWSDANQNNQNSGGGNGQSNNWNNVQNGNAGVNNQRSNWNNENRQPSGSGSGSQPTPAGSHSNARVLYGPYGPYYGAKSLAQKGPPPDAGEEPRYDVPQAIAQSKGVTKQVQPGPGYLYVKKRSAPTYIDTLDEPYAKFVFKYRTREQLKHEIGVDVSEPSGDEEINALENLDRAELIQLVLRAKGALGGAIPEPPPRPTPTFMNEFQQIPVPAPDMSYLHYSLPAMRNVSNNAGLGIRYSSSSQRNGGTPNQNNNQQNNWSNGGGGDQTWANNDNQQQSSGWDGVQERRISMGPPQAYQNSGGQAPSRRSSGISPKNMSQSGAPSGASEQAAFNKPFPGPAPARQPPPQGYPPPPPPILGAVGVTGGGVTSWQDDGGEAFGGSNEAGTAQPKHGW